MVAVLESGSCLQWRCCTIELTIERIDAKDFISRMEGQEKAKEETENRSFHSGRR
jgi:hypothetical protein